MDKIKEFLEEYPAVRVFGKAGIIITFILLTQLSQQIFPNKACINAA